jgi:hypothetical protein
LGSRLLCGSCLFTAKPQTAAQHTTLLGPSCRFCIFANYAADQLAEDGQRFAVADSLTDKAQLPDSASGALFIMGMVSLITVALHSLAILLWR